MTAVLKLGYLGFEVSDLDAWESFGRDLVGLHCERVAPDLLVMRLDRYARRLVFKRGARDDLVCAGWEVADQGALAVMVERLKTAGFPIERCSVEEARERAVADAFRFTDGAGNPVELFCAPAMAALPCPSPLISGGFVTDAKGLGHYVAGYPDLALARALYCDQLGLKVSDYIHQHNADGTSLSAMFLHANRRHHSIALVEGKLQKNLDHFFLQMREFEDVGKAYDRFIASPYAIRNTIGQHPNDHGVSFYAFTPSGFSIEIGWSDFELDDATWSTRSFDRISVWGHKHGGADGQPHR